MNNRSKLHNFMILLFSVSLLASFIFSFMWGHDAKRGILYIFSSTFCAGELIIMGGFLFILPSQKQNRFIKESFFNRLMNQEEKEEDFFNLLFRGQKRIIGLLMLLFGLVTVFTLYY